MEQNFQSDRSNQKKWSTLEGGPSFPKILWSYQIIPFNFGLKFSEISSNGKRPKPRYLDKIIISCNLVQKH